MQSTDSGFDDTPATARFERHVPAVPGQVPRLRRELATWAQGLGLDDEQVQDVRLAVSEALTNAVIHAFVGREPGTVRVVAEPGADVLEVRVTDDGGGMGPRPDSPGLGMGVPMIGKLCATVDLAPGAGGAGTEVRMVFAVDGLLAPRGEASEHLPGILAALSRMGAGDTFGGADIGTLADLLVPGLADLCSVTLLEADGSGRRVGARVARPDGTPDPEATAWVMAFPLAVASAPSLLAVSTGRTTVARVDEAFARRVSPDARRAEEFLALGLSWWAAVPLRSGRRAVGFVAVGGRQGSPGPVVAVLEQVAEQAGGLVAAARLLDDLRRTQGRLERILGTLGEAVMVSDAAGRVVYANAAAADLLEATDVEEVLRATAGAFTERFVITGEHGEPIPADELPARRVLAGRPAAPLLARSVSRVTGRARWLRVSASRLEDGPLVVNVLQDVTEIREAQVRLTLLARAGEALAAGLGRPDTYLQIARLTVPVVADGCIVELAGEDGETGPAIVHHVEGERARALESDEARERLRSAGGPGVVTLPMAVQDRTLGLLTLVNDVSGRAFSDEDVACARDIAQRAAVSVDNARLQARSARVNEELQTSLSRLRLLADAGFGGLVRGVQDRIVEANATFLRMVGYDSTDELPPWPQMTPPEWARADAAAVAQMRATGTSEIFEKEYLRRDGTRVRVLLGATVSDPAAFEWISVVVDVSERRSRDARADTGLDRLTLGRPGEPGRTDVADVVSGLAAAVLIQRPGEGIVYANQAAAEAMGMASPQEVMAATPEQIAEGWETFDEDGVPLAADRYPSRRILAGERDVPPLTVRTISRVSGREYWRLVRARAVLGDAGQLVMAVSMTEDITQMRRAMLTQRLLAEAGRVLSSSLDYGETLQGVARLTVPELADWCTVSIPEDHGRLRTVAVAHADPAKVQFARDYNARYPESTTDEGGAAAILRGGPAVLTPDIPDDLLRQHITDPEQLALLRGIGMRSVIQVPIVTPGRPPIGVLSLVNAESRRVFTDADLLLAEELGRRAGTAVQNARLHTERSRIAATLQRSLLPGELPRIPGYELSCSYRPAGEESWVGGDFYDVFAVEEGWMAIVGDVAGHGAPAAALTAQARHTLRAIGEVSGDPVKAIAHLNRLLLPRDEPALVTVCAVLVREDPAHGGPVATIACAGHPLPYLRRDGRVVPVGRPGPLLGAWASAVAAVDVPLHDGDVLTIYTDGVLDARAGPEHFGERRLVQALAGAAGAREAVARVQRALDDFGSGPQADDTAILAIERLAQGRLRP